ncbi:TniQ family protein [Undibacterium sp. TS12]|uniref:TniQ family protein n=1 Tax=Undibacterium sp. TS12 TaxID=2908202 RepID=UPI001F4C81E2|nr:TniQ family protein [Undibacterium sp. TS12]MCH8618147.1 TniQ family protein [Undibacterium sp. TS12]
MNSHSLNGTSPELASVRFSELLVRPRRRPSEGKMGYMKRVLSENNLTRSMADQVIFNNQDVQDFSSCSKKPNQNLGKRNWNVKHARFCPLCLSLDPIWKIEWELRHFDACPIHQCWLVDECSKCGKNISWGRQQLLSCDCSKPLTEIKSTVCPPSVVAISAELLRSLNESRGVPHLPVITHLQIDEIQRVVKLFGYNKHLEKGLSPTKTFIISPDDMKKSKVLAEICGEVLGAWPESFYSSLAFIEQEYRSDANENRLTKCFGSFYTRLYRDLEGTDYDFIRKAFENYLVSSWRGAIAERNTRLASGKRAGNWLPGSLACKELSISPKRLDKMISDGEIDGYTYTSKKSQRNRTYVNKADFDKKKIDLASTIDLHEATQLLGLSKKRMAELRATLFPLAEKLFSSKKSQWSIHRSYVDRILAVSDSLLPCKYVERGLITFGHVMRYWKLGSENIAKLIEAVASGRIKPVSVSSQKQGICSWVLPVDELSSYIGTLERSDEASITVQEFASRLQMKQEVAYFLVRHHFVESFIADEDRVKQSRITMEALAKFSNTYVFLSGIAKKMNCSSRGLISRLQKFGICPVAGPTIDGCRQVIMRRTRDFELAIEAIAHEQRKDA